MIHRAKFQNFKALRDVEITFDSRLTVLVGPNGSGKTSVLQGIDNVLNSGERGHTASIFDLANIGSSFDSFVTNRSSWLQIELALGKWVTSAFQVRVRAEQNKRARPPESRWQVDRHYKSPTNPNWFDFVLVEDAPGLDAVWCDGLFLHFEASKLAAPSVSQFTPGGLGADGTGFASLLAGLALSKPEWFQELVSELRRVVPSVRAVRFQRVPIERTEPMRVSVNGQELLHYQRTSQVGEELLFDFELVPAVRASGVSEGTLLTLAILAAVRSAGASSVVLLDDLDHGLHPKAQMELVGVLRKLLDQFPDLQIIATSHSPYILDKLKPEEVRVIALRDDGTSACARLEQHPKYPMWKDSMSPGEFWSHAGEDWIKKLPAEPVAQ